MLTFFTSNSSRFRWAVCLTTGLVCLLFSLNSMAATPGGDDSNKLSTNSAASSWFSIVKMEPVGDLLYFTYKIRYPGMTKVRLYEGDSEEPVWRGQYVNREEGVYTVRFKTTMMKSGLEYRFEFDYKNHVVPRYYTP